LKTIHPLGFNSPTKDNGPRLNLEVNEGKRSKFLILQKIPTFGEEFWEGTQKEGKPKCQVANFP